MAQLICPICGKRRPERFCPAKGEKICAVCCGKEREVTLDCPADCTYLISGLAFTIAQFAAANPDLTDQQALTALMAVGETYRTLVSGIYYEKPPAVQPAAGLYAALGKFIQDYKKQETERVGFSSIKDSEIFYLLVFLARFVRNWTNGRSRARMYIHFLRSQFPQSESQPEPSRIIAP